jgi:O-antigen/teichoic acid export membrane protein
MAGNFLRNLKANTLQLLLNQGFGIAAFYILATQLNKNAFGELNWALAIMLTVFGILTLGLDQVVVKKIAAGEDPKKLVSVYTGHVLVSGLCFYIVLVLASLIFHGSFTPSVIILLGAGKLFYFFSSPFKQLAAGREQFKQLMYMSVVSNILKATLLFILALTNNISLFSAVIVYVISDLAELIASIYFARKRLDLNFEFKDVSRNYLSLLMEAWPQVGNVVFFAAMARIDWILVGIILSAVKLAEYSFAYRFFEITLMPLYIIGPLLLPYFSRKLPDARSEEKPFTLLKMEIVLATFIGLMLAVLWSPVVDGLTAGKYGAVNQSTIFFLVASMPLLYVNNFFWSILFSQNRLKTILGIIIITLSINIVADLILIPRYQNAGAAAGYMVAIIVQCLLFLRACRLYAVKVWETVLLVPVIGAASLTLAITMMFPVWITGIITTFFFSLLIVATRQVKRTEWKIITMIK